MVVAGTRELSRPLPDVRLMSGPLVVGGVERPMRVPAACGWPGPGRRRCPWRRFLEIPLEI